MSDAPVQPESNASQARISAWDNGTRFEAEEPDPPEAPEGDRLVPLDEPEGSGAGFSLLKELEKKCEDGRYDPPEKLEEPGGGGSGPVPPKEREGDRLDGGGSDPPEALDGGGPDPSGNPPGDEPDPDPTGKLEDVGPDLTGEFEDEELDPAEQFEDEGPDPVVALEGGELVPAEVPTDVLEGGGTFEVAVACSEDD
ncbi:hypothetical protein BGZ65_002184 [Modicella reniformis]|uniref:Uncharacterized protein n=1 Tax=Modicella reniformis TaxID=1440133 RepID=A0A9P6INB9_9FUNG|nr:hypothetical protein BGZ65_002184 [Modicella reniformis]